jgi:hypothetical protein
VPLLLLLLLLFPWSAPTNAALANIWLTELVKPEFQGCGHIRLMLTPATAAAAAAAAAATCSAPTNAALVNTWLTELAKPEFQGCRHIRLMLTCATAAAAAAAGGGGAFFMQCSYKCCSGQHMAD